MKVLISVTSIAFVVGCTMAHAQYTEGTIKIGVMNDMSGLYSDISGRGSVVAARMAVEDFGAVAKGMKVEIVGADHQNKPDVGSNIVRSWIDLDKVDVIVDVPTSSIALAVNEIVREKNKVFLVSGAAASDLTGPKCSRIRFTGPMTPGRPLTAPAKQWLKLAETPGSSSPQIMRSGTRSSVTLLQLWKQMVGKS